MISLSNVTGNIVQATFMHQMRVQCAQAVARVEAERDLLRARLAEADTEMRRLIAGVQAGEREQGIQATRFHKLEAQLREEKARHEKEAAQMRQDHQREQEQLRGALATLQAELTGIAHRLLEQASALSVAAGDSASSQQQASIALAPSSNGPSGSPEGAASQSAVQPGPPRAVTPAAAAPSPSPPNPITALASRLMSSQQQQQQASPAAGGGAAGMSKLKGGLDLFLTMHSGGGKGGAGGGVGARFFAIRAHPANYSRSVEIRLWATATRTQQRLTAALQRHEEVVVRPTGRKRRCRRARHTA